MIIVVRVTWILKIFMKVIMVRMASKKRIVRIKRKVRMITMLIMGR